MGLEIATYIDDLVTTNPISGDDVAEGDDHIRMLKDVLKNTFPGVSILHNGARILGDADNLNVWRRR